MNELLRVESSAANLDGGQLTTTYRDNIGDKGVDAGLRRAVGTKYIPPGDSAWQFKAGDLSAAKCKKELRDAEERGGSAALDVVRAGGTYRLVLGADLTDTKVRARREALQQEAAALGINVQPGMFEVLNASDLRPVRDRARKGRPLTGQRRPPVIAVGVGSLRCRGA